MQVLRHSLALVAIFASGCFLSHEAGSPRPPPPGFDAGPDRPDGGGAMCEEMAGYALALRCPDRVLAPGETAQVEVEHAAALCCSSGTGSLSVRSTGPREYTLTSRWQACDCCIECNCVDPSTTETVRVGPLEPGVHVVRDGMASCEIRVEEPSTCGVVPAAARSARVLFDDQGDDVTLAHVAGADCGCRAELAADRVGSRVDVLLCECTDSCDDVITPYEGGFRGSVRGVGEYVRELGGAPAPLSVRTPDTCFPLEALDVSVLLPDESAHPFGEPLVWVAVDGEQSLCCAEPLPAVRTVSVRPGVIELELYTCVLDDCFCEPPAPTRFTGWHSLGALDPGDWVVRVGRQRARFTVR